MSTDNLYDIYAYYIMFLSDKAVFVNGRFCKDPKLVDEDDFYFSGLNVPAKTENQLGSNVTGVNVDKIPGLNTLGIVFALRLCAVWGKSTSLSSPSLRNSCRH